MARYDALFRAQFENYGRTVICYAEGRFGLAEADSPLTIHIPGTDLLRRPALLTPEFELSQFEELHHPLERCTIYDVGAKSFEYDTYLIDVIDYWRKLEATGMTLLEAYEERWPLDDYASAEALKRARADQWTELPDREYQRLGEACRRIWTPEQRTRAASREALTALCRSRASTLEALLE
jgi:hypothetical protein